VDYGQVTPEIPGPAFTTIFEPGAVLYGTRRTYLRKVGVAEFKGVSANTTLALGVLGNQMMAEYLPWLMSGPSFVEFSIRESKGSVNPFINWSDIARFEFDLPSLDEQHRVVEVMQAVDREIALSNNIANASKQALLTFITTKVVKEHGARAWKSARLGELVSIEYGAPLPATSRQGGSIPVYGSAGIVGWHSSALIEEPSVIIGRKGSAGTVYWSSTPSYPIDTAFWVKVKEQLLPKFCYYTLLGSNVPRLVAGTGVPGLSRQALLTVPVAYPSLEEQLALVEHCEEYENLHSSSVNAMGASRSLRTTLLQELIG
jgi:type I restriction enzyme S subunit